MREMNLSVITPVLNEEFFLPLYLEAVARYADEILLLDGGSRDNTIRIIKDFQARKTVTIRFWEIPQNGIPYSNDWDEGRRRNFLLERARGRWVLVLDADEFLSDNFKDIFQQRVLSDTSNLIYGFSFIPFWRDVNTVRVNVPEDPHWEGYIYRLIRRDAASYSSEGNHSILLCNGKHPYLCQRKDLIEEVSLFHYHYALGPRLKFNDNRRGDLGCYDNQFEPDWNYQPPDYQIKTREFRGKHPSVIRKYLERMIE